MSGAIHDYRFATVSPQGVEWKLKRNCSVTPMQMCGVLVLLGGVSLFVAAFFWMQGATLVLPFAVWRCWLWQLQWWCLQNTLRMWSASAWPVVGWWWSWSRVASPSVLSSRANGCG